MSGHELRWLTGMVTAALLGGCVTINIYFPAAAAEKAADKIIDEVWRTPKGAPPASVDTPPAAPATKGTSE